MFLGKVLDFAIPLHVVHHIAGRLRINVPDIKKIPPEWRLDEESVTSIFLVIKGVTSVSFSYVTGNVLFIYDPTVTDEDKIIKAVRKIIYITASYKKDLEKITKEDLRKEILRIADKAKKEMEK